MMNLYEHKRVRYTNECRKNDDPGYTILVVSTINGAGANCYKLGDSERVYQYYLLDFLAPIFKPGDFVEVKLPVFNTYATMHNGIWQLVEEKPIHGNTNYAWECLRDGQTAPIHEAWMYPTENKSIANACTCDIMALMAYGCKCGQIQRERNGIQKGQSRSMGC